MADNVEVDNGTGLPVATDEVTHSGDAGQHVQLFRPVLVSGSEGSKTVVDLPGDATNGLDVDVTRVQQVEKLEYKGTAGTATWNSGTATNTAVTIACDGFQQVVLQIRQTGTPSGGELEYEATIDGTNWFGLPPYELDDPDEMPGDLTSTAIRRFRVTGLKQWRVRLGGTIFGDLELLLHAQATTAVLETRVHRLKDSIRVVGHDNEGDSAGTAPVLVAGRQDDGTITTPRVDSAGDLQVDVKSLSGELPAGDNNIGNVDIASAIPAGTNNIGDVDVVSLPALPAGDNNIGNVDIASAIPAGTNSIGQVTANAGTNLNTSALALEAGGNLATAVNMLGVLQSTVTESKQQVDVVTLPVLPTGGNNIGDVDVASIAAGDNNIGNVDVLTLPALPAGTNNIGDVDVLTIAAGTNAIGNVGIVPRTSGGFDTFHLVSAGSTNATNIKAGAGQLFGWYLYNSNAAARKLAFHNTAGTPTAGASVFFSITVPPLSGANVMTETGIAFSTGIAITTVTGLPDNDSAAVAVNDLMINLWYK